MLVGSLVGVVGGELFRLGKRQGILQNAAVVTVYSSFDIIVGSRHRRNCSFLSPVRLLLRRKFIRVRFFGRFLCVCFNLKSVFLVLLHVADRFLLWLTLD